MVRISWKAAKSEYFEYRISSIRDLSSLLLEQGALPENQRERHDRIVETYPDRLVAVQDTTLTNLC